MSQISLNPLLTEAGLAALRNSLLTGVEAVITEIALGDAGSEPNSSVTSLTNELLRAPCFSGGITGKKQVTLAADIPAGEPEFFVRELGFFLDDGTLFAYWSHPEQPLGYRSQTTPWFFKFILSWDDASSVTVTFDTDNALTAVAQDVYALESKIEHTLQSAGMTPADNDETQLTEAIKSMAGLPAGLITASVASSVKGFLLCNGSQISRTVYSDLFNVIKTSFGGGDGSTTFTLPDYRGCFLRGLGGNSQANVYTKQGDAIRNITGTCASGGGIADATTNSGAFRQTNVGSFSYGTYGTVLGATFDASRVVSTSNENRPVNYAVNWFIKY